MEEETMGNEYRKAFELLANEVDKASNDASDLEMRASLDNDPAMRQMAFHRTQAICDVAVMANRLRLFLGQQEGGELSV